MKYFYISDDSREHVDIYAIDGVDLPRRQKSKQLRYNHTNFRLFQMGMTFKRANQFREALVDYVVYRGVQLTIRPNKEKMIRVKRRAPKFPWLLFGSIDGRSWNFII